MMSQHIGFLIFRIGIPALILFIQYRLFRRVMSLSIEGRPPRFWIRVARILFAVFNVILIVVSMFRPRLMDLPEWLLYPVAYPFFIWHGGTLFIGLILGIGWLVKSPFVLGLKLARRNQSIRKKVETVVSHPSFQQFDTSRRSFMKSTLYGLSTLSFAGSAYGVMFGKYRYEITSAEFAIRNLPHHFEGFTIGFISDIHSSMFMTKREMDEYVSLMNSLQADLIVVPGDFVNSLVDEVYPFAEAFSNLRAPYGVYGVMGNHDFFTRDPELVAKEVDGCGIKLLRDDRVAIEKNGDRFYLVGVDDVGRADSAREKMATALRNAAIGIPKVLLCHRPYFLPQAREFGIDLVLSGHTHGGQVSFGRFGGTVLAPASFASPYVSGRYSLGQTSMYVSRGIGTVGLPIRINCPPEITKLTLIRA